MDAIEKVTLAERLDGIERARWVVPALFALAIGLRLAMVLLLPQVPMSDAEWYVVRAGEMVRGLGYQEAGHPTAFWPVGFPALLAASMWLFGGSLVGPMIVNLVSAAVIFGLVLWFARALGLPPLAGRVAALLYALYPAHIAYSGVAASETASTAVAMAAFALLLRGRHRPLLLVASGVMFGAATLMRAQMMLFPIGGLVAIGWALRDMRLREMVRAAVILHLAMAAVVLPWSVRNERVLGAFVPVSTNGGVALYTGANDQATGDWFAWEHGPLWERSGIPFAQRVERQVELDVRFKRLAKDWIAANPGRWTLLGFKKMALLWRKDTDGFWSLDESYPDHGTAVRAAQAGNQLYYVMLLALGLPGIGLGVIAMLRRRRERAPLALLACMPVFATLTAFGFSGQIRYHYPAMPFVVIGAGWTLALLLRRWAERVPKREALPA